VRLGPQPYGFTAQVLCGTPLKWDNTVSSFVRNGMASVFREFGGRVSINPFYELYLATARRPMTSSTLQSVPDPHVQQLFLPEMSSLSGCRASGKSMLLPAKTRHPVKYDQVNTIPVPPRLEIIACSVNLTIVTQQIWQSAVGRKRSTEVEFFLVTFVTLSSFRPPLDSFSLRHASNG